MERGGSFTDKDADTCGWIHFPCQSVGRSLNPCKGGEERGSGGTLPSCPFVSREVFPRRVRGVTEKVLTSTEVILFYTLSSGVFHVQHPVPGLNSCRTSHPQFSRLGPNLPDLGLRSRGHE